MDSWAIVGLVGPLVKGPTWCFRSGPGPGDGSDRLSDTRMGERSGDAFFALSGPEWWRRFGQVWRYTVGFITQGLPHRR
jgi:hypothetical protein